MNLILLRGLPGAGKTTLAKLLSEEKWPCYSVDDFFTDEKTGDYSFDHKQNHLAYKQCEENTRIALQSGIEKVFVHNTFTIDWELEPYFKMAAEFGYALHIVTVENYHGNTNVHQIPNEQLQKMAEKYKVRLM
ncbi:MAG TPA: AAA family ATPase [Flavobacteriales bacterium]|nr:AAA family ATPase [Flavobacteriales bacterium]HRE73973.1 AAA family ATPase [Flavobacteriales bacterium]HRE96635.1 AAA family ATPase [Flavobacteriales bacterium]HRJ35480.1 AAA family ATPase [Flavobacteriales bacterium]HRJ39540.1 AAA family ATPase [Flavobacteriales bacterium]